MVFLRFPVISLYQLPTGSQSPLNYPELKPCGLGFMLGGANSRECLAGQTSLKESTGGSVHGPTDNEDMTMAASMTMEASMTMVC